MLGLGGHERTERGAQLRVRQLRNELRVAGRPLLLAQDRVVAPGVVAAREAVAGDRARGRRRATELADGLLDRSQVRALLVEDVLCDAGVAQPSPGLVKRHL